MRRQETQAYYTNLDNVDPLYIHSAANVQSHDELKGDPYYGPRFGSAEQTEIVSGGRFANPRGTWGGVDHESYADGATETAGYTDYESMLSHEERPLGSPNTRPSQWIPSNGPYHRLPDRDPPNHYRGA